MSVFLIEGLLTPGECDRARHMFPAPQPAAVNAGAAGTAWRPIRRSKVSFMPERCWLTDRVREALYRANREFDFEVVVDVEDGVKYARSEALQLAEYGEGDAYGWHLDIGPGAAERRKLSVSVQLSRSDDYEGGDLEIWGAPKIDRAQGAAIVFPSHMLHQVRPVKRGLRRSIVGWAVGPTHFR